MKDRRAEHLHEVDAALRQLGTAEPRAGLEGRVQARLALVASNQRAWWQIGRWELGGGLVAVGAVLAVLAVHRESRSTALPAFHTAQTAQTGTSIGSSSGTSIGILIGAAGQSGLSTAAGRATPVSGVPVHSSGRAHTQHRAGSGRAAIARNAHRASGVVLPGAPVPLHN